MLFSSWSRGVRVLWNHPLVYEQGMATTTANANFPLLVFGSCYAIVQKSLANIVIVKLSFHIKLLEQSRAKHWNLPISWWLGYLHSVMLSGSFFLPVDIRGFLLMEIVYCLRKTFIGNMKFWQYMLKCNLKIIIFRNAFYGFRNSFSNVIMLSYLRMQPDFICSCSNTLYTIYDEVLLLAFSFGLRI